MRSQFTGICVSAGGGGGLKIRDFVLRNIEMAPNTKNIFARPRLVCLVSLSKFSEKNFNKGQKLIPPHSPLALAS